MIKSLTGIRGFAALWVFAYHTFTLLDSTVAASYPEFFRLFFYAGWLGVDIFFVLSGFLLTMGLLNQNKQSFRSYIKRRVYRIIPAYYFQLFFLLALYLVLSIHINIVDFLLHFAMLHGFTSAYFGSINGVYWTLPLEFWFYFVLPIFFIYTRYFLYYVGLLIVGAILYRYFAFPIVEGQSAPDIIKLIYQLPGVLDQFAFGMLFAYLRFYKNIKVITLLGYLLAVLGLGLFYYTITFIDGSMWKNRILLALSKEGLDFGLGLFIFAASYNLRLIDIIFANRVALFFGNISYSIYLWHFILFYLIFSLSVFEGKLPFVFSKSGLGIFELILYTWPIVIAVSYLSYRFIEMPFIRLAKAK